MHYEVEINGRLREVSVHRANGRFMVTVEGRERIVDAARVDAYTWSLLIEQPGRRGLASCEVSMSPAPTSDRLAVQVGSATLTVALNGRRRSSRKDTGGQPGSGPQRITAPMPGKVVRILVTPGETVHARQPIIVVEAMKMENELSAARDGTVGEIRVRDGQSVDAGALLVMIV